MKLLQERIKNNMTKYTRTALLAECADKALILYEELGEETDNAPEIARSIEIAWDYACNKPIDKDEYQACLEVVHETSSYYIDVEDPLLSDFSLVVERLLQSLSPDENDSCLATAKGLYAIIDTAASAEQMADDEAPVSNREQVATGEEEEWQEKAILLAEKWDGIADRNMFDALGHKPPNWILDWQKRCDL